MQAEGPGVAEADEQLQGLSRIQIAVRVRAVLPHEALQQVAVTCSSDGSSVQVVLPEREFSKPAIAASSKPDAKAYEFDACLTGSTTQAEVFDVCGISDLVDAAVDGYNVTVFAFGQTGSGKTYTIIGPIMAGMQGFEDGPADGAAAVTTPTYSCSTPPAELDTPAATAPDSPASSAWNGAQHTQQQQPQQQPLPLPLPEHEGLLARCVHRLYASIGERRDSVQCSVSISCTEVYNETVTDMLARNKNQQLPVRLDPRSDAFYVEGLTHAPAHTPGRALRVLSKALSWRHTRAHKLNSYSSRSHCLVTLTISSQDVGSPGQELMQGVQSGMRRCGKLVLVDLAGSERLNSTGNSGQRESLKETGAINKSLFTLGQVLAALSVRGGVGGNSHVPYRDSRLTQLLWEGLRGGGRVLMLACLCPLKSAAEESLNTLHFASMALRIKSTPVIMMDPQDIQLNEMRSMIKVLQEDCKSLANALTQICNAGAGADISSVLQTLPPTLVQDALRYGSASAPALDQQLRQRSPPGRGQKSRRGSLRLTGSMGKPKAIYVSKPGTADPAMRHSMPALPYHSRSGPASPTRGPSSWQHSQSNQQLQQHQQWSGGLGGDILPPLSHHGSGRSSPSPTWNVYGNSMPLGATKSKPTGKAASGSGAGRLLDGVGNLSLGPSAGAKLYPGRLRQELYHAGASGLNGVLAAPQGCLGCKPGWAASSKLDAPPPRTSQLHTVGPPAHRPGRGQGAGGGADAATGSTYPAGSGGIWGLSATAGVSKLAQEPQPPKLDSFPELAALEQQFQMRQQQQDQAQANSPAKQFDVQLLGSSGVLLPSGLHASISDPRSLVPVRIGVADGDCLGTSPDASPVAVALAAADSLVRPIAVPLPADLTAAAAAAAAAATDGGGERAGGQSVNADGAAQPDPKALTWAQRNVWFGTDEEMTRLAYEVHDMLVGEQGVDPTSQLYYTAIESHVAAAFPDKWAHWQQLTSDNKGRASTTQGSGQQQSTYVSYKLPLKPSVPRFNSPGGSPPRQQQQQQQVRPEGSSPPYGRTAAAPAVALPLSQLLQHPALGSALSGQQQQQQQQWQQQQMMLDRSLPQQLLQQYQQEHPRLVLQQLQQQQQQLQQQMHVAVMALHAGSGQQQQQQVRSSLPELPQSESPQPQGESGEDSSHQQQQQQQQQQQGSPDSPAAAADSTASGLGLLGTGSGLGLSAGSLGEQSHRRSRYHQQHPQHPQQQQYNGTGLTASRSSLGGISAAAMKVLQTSQPSFYDGAGPLTSGTKPVWTSGNQCTVQAGQDLAQVLRSGLNPGNKSLAEMQAEYKAARSMVLDRLRQQKEAAEVQRKQILLQLGRAISSSAWRA